MLSELPIAVLVFLASMCAFPVTYCLDRLAAMEDQRWVFFSALVILPMFCLMCMAFTKDSPGKKDVLFKVWSIFAFTGIVDLIIALELDGYLKGFMEFYLREGEPYLRSSYGTMINYWDGLGHFSMYIVMIALLCSGKNYRYVGLYWVGSINHSMVVYMPGNVTGNKGLKWSYLLNVPYVVCPLYAAVRFLQEGKKIKHKEPSTKKQWEKVVEWGFCGWFAVATVMAMFRMVACMGCKDWICQFYVKDIEPYLVDPTQYGRTQALCYFYYFLPFYVAAICSHIYEGQHWVKDWSIIHAGASAQAQLVFISCSFKWRTQDDYIVPNTVLARCIFWVLNLSLILVPHLHAMYCNRMELREFISKEVTPRIFGKRDQVTSPSPKKNKIPVRQNGPVTRQQSHKLHEQ